MSACNNDSKGGFHIHPIAKCDRKGKQMSKKDIKINEENKENAEETTEEVSTNEPVDENQNNESNEVEENSEESEASTDENKEAEEPQTIDEVLDEVVDFEAEMAAQKDKYVRLMAEFDNYKRRSAKEYERLVSSANKDLMMDIIEVRDNFERAISMADEKHDFAEFLKGMRLLFTKLDDNLSKNGLTVFTEVGDEFNPELHDAMLQTPSDEIEEGHIAQIYEKGYKLKDQVIKHAKVIVSSGPAAE